MSAIPDLNYEEYLSESEKRSLQKMNTKSNALHQLKDTNFLNLSLNEIIGNWSRIHLEMLHEIMGLLRYMEESDSNNILEFLRLFTQKTLIILTHKNERLIYVGISLILLSGCFYFISITK